MKVTIATLRMPPVGWKLELELDRNTTVAQLKAHLAALSTGPRITSKTRILNNSVGGQLYSLRDEEKLAKSVLLADPSQEVSDDAPPEPAATAAAVPAAKAPAVGAAAGAKALAPKAPSPHGVSQQTSDLMASAAAMVASAQRLEQRLLTSPSGAAFQPKARPSPFGVAGIVQASGQDLKTKQRLVRKLMSQWPLLDGNAGLVDPFGVRRNTSALAIVKDQADLFGPLISGEVEHAVKVAIRIFAESPNLFRMHKNGTAAINEYMLQMAHIYFELCKPTLTKHGFASTVAGLAQMDQVLLRSVDAPDVFEELYHRFISICFGISNAPPIEEMGIHAIIGMGVMSLGGPVLTVYPSYLQHLALPPLERRHRSIPRTLAWVEMLLQQQLGTLKLPANRRGGSRRSFWVLGASANVEWSLAREGVFVDAGALTEREVDVVLVGHGLPSGSCPRDQRVQVSARSFEDLDFGALPEDLLLVFCMHTGLGTLDPELSKLWLPRLVKLVAKPNIVLIMTCRSQAEADAELALLVRVGVKPFIANEPAKYVRNLFSGMAGNPDIEFDENGWFMAYAGLQFDEAALDRLLADIPGVCHSVSEELQQLERRQPPDLEPSSEMPDGPEDDAGRGCSKSPVVFWGILDLKYDPAAPPNGRVRVLETGDGRLSKFSGYGAAIKETFEKEQRLEETIRCAVLTENKKLTHDTIVECGYAHLRPKQRIYAKSYKEDLAAVIIADFQLSQSGCCVLKLCNRTRGAGVVPVMVKDLDKVLHELLCPPEDADEWLRQQPLDWFKTVTNGCFDEQARHWWSNECPVFIVEDFCLSIPTVKDGRSFDGTMRVGFSLHKEQRDRLPPGWLHTPDGVVFSAHADGLPPETDVHGQPVFRPKPWDDDRPYMDLFRSGEMSLRVHWLGGYWKLPLEDLESSDLRGKCVSVAKQGTAPVAATHLHDVYTTLGDMVATLFNSSAHSLSHMSLSRKYNEHPEFAAFVSSRLAASMRLRDRQRAMQILDLAQLPLGKLQGPCKDLVMSYIQRNRAIHEAMHTRWEAAENGFKLSVQTMPLNATARYLVGIARLEANDYRGAEACFREALCIDPDFKAPYVNLGYACLKLGKYDEAVEACTCGLARHPQTPHASYNLALASFALACIPGGDTEGQRARALDGLSAAREARVQSQLWSEQDDELAAMLESGALTGPRNEPPREGWKLINWRP